jgi:membrane protein DedA with SNARE-associated domain
VLATSSITGSLVTFAIHAIRDLGYGGIMLMIICSAVIAVPGTEAPMLFAGFNVYQHHLTMLGIIGFGVLGDVVGATIAYIIGWFAQYGPAAVFVGRLLPLVRAAFSYAAGTAKMPYWKFISFSALGSLVWISALGFLGKAVGSNWPSWHKHLGYVDDAFAVILVLVIVWFVWRRFRRPPAALA